jgi:hypothetical protein
MAAPLMVEAVMVVRDEEKERQGADGVWVRDVIRIAAFSSFRSWSIA